MTNPGHVVSMLASNEGCCTVVAPSVSCQQRPQTAAPCLSIKPSGITPVVNAAEYVLSKSLIEVGQAKGGDRHDVKEVKS